MRASLVIHTTASIALVALQACSCGRHELEGVPDALDDDGTVDPGEAEGEPDADALDPADDPDAEVDPDATCNPDGPLDGSHWVVRIGGPDEDRATSIVTKPDGSILVMGSTDPMSVPGSNWIVTVSGDGELLDSKIIEGTDSWYGNLGYAILLRDCGILLAGTTTTYGAGDRDLWLMRLDAAGALVWQKALGDAGEESLPSVIETADGGFLVEALTKSYSIDYDVLLVKLGGDARIEWQYRIGWAAHEVLLGTNTMAEGADGTIYVLAGLAEIMISTRYDPWILALEQDGDVRWQKVLDTGGNDGGYSMILDDSGLALAGYTESSPSPFGGAWVVKLDATGNPTWQKSFTAGGWWEGANGIIARGDGGFLVAGSLAPEETTDKEWLASMDPDGALAWQEYLGEGSMQALRLHGDGIVMIGGNAGDVLVARIGLDGTFPGACPLVEPASASSTETTATVHDTDLVPLPTTAVVQDARATFVDMDLPYERLCPE